MFPEQYARTRRFSLGAPQRFTVSPDGDRVVFTRSVSGTDARTLLWLHEDGRERLLAEDVTSYGADRDVRTIAYVADGSLWTVSTDGGAPIRIATPVPPADPCPSPDGRTIAYGSAGSVRLVGAHNRVLASPERAEVTYGRPPGRIVDAVPMMSTGRFCWWSPDGDALLILRVDTSGMQRRHIADPANPEQAPRSIPYAVPGSALPVFSLSIVTVDGKRTPIELPTGFEYLFTADWGRAGPVVTLVTRDQHTMWIGTVDPATGHCEPIHRTTDDAWVEMPPGTPLHTESGVPVLPALSGDTRAITIGDVVSPSGTQIREVIGAVDERVYFTASEDPTSTHVWCHTPADGFVRLTSEPGIHTAAVGGNTVVLDSRTAQGHNVLVVRDAEPSGSIAVLTEAPLVTSKPIHLVLGERQLRSRLHLPSDYTSGKLPVLLMPYAGPGRQTVTMAADRTTLLSQWFADQGFAVLVTDGRGTPGRGVQWQRAVIGDRLMPVIDDQVDALHAAADRYDFLDLDRVGIRGYSFGGYVAAGAVLHRPDVFHTAVAGSTTTECRLYTPFWPERVLGDPATNVDAYDRCSLIAHADKLTRPLMLIYGDADDNVLPVHTLRFSAALLAAGKPHVVLPLPGQGHVPAGIGVLDTLLGIEAGFLRETLSLPAVRFGLSTAVGALVK
ncbi:MAG TPA: prolyl oligopeptidase family serine peptidase [Micromonosporaceae bacterium]